eukprot:CAMPEP_0172623592 /NCGR_PEP_ID=MMETSP1068-20121228/130056_1 /TAXON_ID=35684 /ORGANISM="Pseudopedinella elastica, Strain CCMP716" /LENGTH=124 /DNA_ID=CAMNT_0013432217 /DNA_START=96 /DNA_END=470 /DNA_ORIENTATION=+
MAKLTTGEEMLQQQTWAVVGDALNPKKPAFRIAEKLRESGKEVFVVNPREKEGRCFAALKDCPSKVDVVDLVISPLVGPRIIDDMLELGIQNVFIQPGAASTDIIEKCAEVGISVHQGCVLIEL